MVNLDLLHIVNLTRRDRQLVVMGFLEGMGVVENVNWHNSAHEVLGQEAIGALLGGDPSKALRRLEELHKRMPQDSSEVLQGEDPVIPVVRRKREFLELLIEALK